jgi:hypothetical protein
VIPGALLVAATALANVGLALAVGALASQERLERAGPSSWAERRAARAASLGRLAAAWALASALLVLWTRSAVIAETPFVYALPAVAAVVAQTHFGHAFLVVVAALLALLGDLGARRGRRNRCVQLFYRPGRAESLAQHAAASRRNAVARRPDRARARAVSRRGADRGRDPAGRAGRRRCAQYERAGRRPRPVDCNARFDSACHASFSAESSVTVH